MSRDPVISLSAREQRELFDEVGRIKSLPAVMVEKDFWVCWVLQHLFALPDAREHLIFKGGTSLSKVWHAIERFSEDIDISLSREWLGFTGDLDPEKAGSRKRRDGLLEQLGAACAAKLKDEVLPALKRDASSELESGKWTIEIAPEDAQTILFTYPSVMATSSDSDYVRRIVRIECGARSDRWPVNVGRVSSFVVEAFPRTATAPVEVPVLSIERTFWEKATILHAEAHRPKEKPTPARFSRHYSDLAMLGDSAVGQNALDRHDLRERVVEHKKIFFPAAWASYDTAAPGQFKLLPSEARIAHLERDYRQMRPMFFNEPLAWDEVLTRLKRLEEKINGAPEA